MISPTPGRVVWYRPNQCDLIVHKDSEPLAAHVAYVWSDTLVNLLVIDSNGYTHSRTSVPLWQGEGDPPTGSSYCEWMPFQKWQAAKAEAVAAKDPPPSAGDACGCTDCDGEPRVSLEQAKAIVETKTAPRVTEASIKDQIAGAAYYYHKHLTICVITLSNGFFVVGKAAPADASNFDSKVGKRYAFEDAFRQIWQLEGYALRDRLARGEG